MKNLLLNSVSIIFLILLLIGCEQNEMLVSPPTTPPHPQDESLPEIPAPTSPNVISLEQTTRKFVKFSEPLDEIYVNIYVKDSAFYYGIIGNLLPDTTYIQQVKVPKDSFQVRLKKSYYWQNLGSRVLGPGTTYSLTYEWSEGVSKTNSSEFSYSLGASGDLFGISLSASMSQTFKEEITISQESRKTETQTVQGIDGHLRVYTVWQLVTEYDFVDNLGRRITKDTLKNVPQIKNLIQKINTTSLGSIGLGGPSIKPVVQGIAELPIMTAGSSNILQLTYDFKINN